MNVTRNLDLWRCKVAHKNEERYSWVQTNRSVPSEGNNPGVPYGAVINLLPLQQTCNSNQTINHLTNQPTQQSSNQSTQSSVWSSWPYIYILVRSASKLPLCVCVCVCVCVVCVCVCVCVCLCVCVFQDGWHLHTFGDYRDWVLLKQHQEQSTMGHD